MSLQDVTIKNEYRTLNDNIIGDFYIPLLSQAVSYRRSVGFFSSTILSKLTYGISKLIQNGGAIQLVASPHLTNEDIEAIMAGYQERQAIIENALLRELREPKNKFEKERLNLLASLIADNKLDIKIAFTESGMYHEKLGIIQDAAGNTVVFTGSMNESLNAAEHNYETIDVFCSWSDSDNRISSKIQAFDNIWNGKENGLTTIDFPQVKEELIKKYQNAPPNYDIDIMEQEEFYKGGDNALDVSDVSSIFDFPETKTPRPYQQQAIDCFKKNNYQCLFAMATGTGKTLTSLFAANELSHHVQLDNILIIVPLKDLVDQWEKDVKAIFPDTIIPIHCGTKWKETLTNLNLIQMLSQGKETSKRVIITTYASYCKNDERILSSLTPEHTLIIADEVHKFGAESYSQKLPEEIPYRIGLSATPKRPYDDKGTQAIFDYFCPSENIYEFSLQDAIEADMLCKYNYYPVPVTLTDEEMENYIELSEKISRIALCIDMDTATKQEREDLQKLLKQRHRIIEKADNKKNTFLDLMPSLVKQYKGKTLVFCPEGTDEHDYGILETYKKELWQRLAPKGIIVSMEAYIQGTKKDIIDKFAQGSIDMLFAKQRLNEGIDIPSTKRAIFIASSTSEREFIQRRGRVLRKSPGKDIAEIYDFIVIPPKSGDYESKYTKLIVDTEMKRAMEFALSAENYKDVESMLRDYI